MFKIVPVLNPDGVWRGYFRTDNMGNNLNRFYNSPSITEQPSIYAVKSLALDLHATGQLCFYIDLHGHISMQGCFIFGNHIDNEENHIKNVMFGRIMGVNCSYFDIQDSSYSEKLMVLKDKNGKSREGSGRVAIFKETGLVNCYTLECSFHNSKRFNPISSVIDGKVQRGKPIKDNTSKDSVYT